MPTLRAKTKISFKVTRRYLEKINLFSQSYYQLYQKYASSSSHSELDNNTEYSSEENLETVLIDQLEMLSLKEREKKVLEFFIDELDESGLLSNWTEIKTKALRLFSNFSDRKIGDLLKIFQTLEPEGVGARSVSEFLIIQVRNFEMEDDAFKALCINILKKEDELLGGHINFIAEEFDLPKEEILDALYFIKNNLNNTLPGRLYSNKKTQFSVPSAEILTEKDTFKVKMLEDYNFVQDPFILKDLTERKTIIENILKYFFSLQNIKLFQSVEYLMPVTQKQVADELGLSYSFVNRIVNRKYILLNNNTILLRNLFQRSINKSQQTVYFLKSLFRNTKYQTMPDIEIQKILKEQGVSIARRTVNYYRNKIGLL